MRGDDGLPLLVGEDGQHVVVFGPTAVGPLKEQDVGQNLGHLIRRIGRLIGDGLNEVARIPNLPPMVAAVPKALKYRYAAICEAVFFPPLFLRRPRRSPSPRRPASRMSSRRAKPLRQSQPAYGNERYSRRWLSNEVVPPGMAVHAASQYCVIESRGTFSPDHSSVHHTFSELANPSFKNARTSSVVLRIQSPKAGADGCRTVPETIVVPVPSEKWQNPGSSDVFTFNTE